MTDEIEPRIREMMTDFEIENMRNRDGWAIGDIVHIKDGDVVGRHVGAWIELFNGDGKAGVFGGVRFMWVDEGAEYDHPWENGYEEAYAYGPDVPREHHDGYYVAEFTDPEDPNVGEQRP